MSVEEWRPVVGWEGLYEVSSRGNVRSLDRRVRSGTNGSQWRTHKGRQLSPCLGGAGYYTVRLCRAGQRERHGYVHRLVCEAFTGAPPPEHEVRHLNGNPLDNRVENLAWGTRSENVQDTIRHGRHADSWTECKRGHPFDEANTYWLNRSGGRRHRACLTCRRASMQLADAKYKAKKRAQAEEVA